MTKIIFHSRGEFGIGHISRSIAIAKAMIKLDTDVMPLMMTECRDTRLLQESGLPFVSIPSRRSLTQTPYWGTKRMAETIWREMTETTIRSFNPAVFVHDTLVYPEIFAYLKSLNIYQALVLRRRKDIDSFISANPLLLPEFDQIIVPHNKEEMSPAELEFLPKDKTEFCGPIVRLSINELDIKGVSRKYNLKPDHFKIVVVNGGGGVLEEDNFATLVGQAIRRVQAEIDKVQVVAIYGPLYHEDCSALYELANCRVGEFEPKMASLMAASNLVISRGGYNTAQEILTLGVPALSIPAERSHDNQLERIQAMSEETAHVTLGASEPDNLAKQILAQIKQPWYEFTPASFNHKYVKGRYKAANLLHQVALARQLNVAKKMYKELDSCVSPEELLVSPVI